MKTCTGCSLEKDAMSFPADGSARCTDCVNERRRRKYAACEKTRARNAAEYKKYVEQNNRLGYIYEWRKNNPEKVRQYWGTTYSKNKDYYIDRAEARKRAKHQQTPPWADLEKIESIYRECRRISEETGIPHEVDHIVPLKGETVSGLNVENNLQILTMEENRRKGNRYIEVY